MSLWALQADGNDVIIRAADLLFATGGQIESSLQVLILFSNVVMVLTSNNRLTSNNNFILENFYLMSNQIKYYSAVMRIERQIDGR